MSLYKSIEKELRKLEDPKVSSIVLQKDLSRTDSSFRSTCYNVASRNGIPIRIDKREANVYEITRTKKDVATAYTGVLQDKAKDLRIFTYNFNLNTLAAAILFLSERVISEIEFASFGTSDVDGLKGSLGEMGLLPALGDLRLENTENSLIIRVKNSSDILLDSVSPSSP